MPAPKQLISPRFAAHTSAPPIAGDRRIFINAVRSKLENGEYKLQHTDCPCGAPEEDVVISEVERYGLPLVSVLCMNCGTIRTNPYLEEDGLHDFYEHFYQQMYGRLTDAESYFQRQRGYGEKILATALPSSSVESWVFEIGCGTGGALKVFQDRGLKAAGCDHSASLIEEGRRRGVRNIYPGSLARLEKELEGVRADLVYLHHVFEHIDDPLLFLTDCRRILAPRGKIVIVVPDVSKIDAFANPAGDLLQFLHIAHKYNFTFAGLQRLCQRGGYFAAKLFPAPELQTSWSVMPELWVQITPHGDHPTSIKADAPVRARAGAHVLGYLRKTERLHKLGLCRGQLLIKMSTHRNQLRTKLRRIKLRLGRREKV